MLCFGKGSKIVGQYLLNPFEWSFRGKKHKGYWGIDYFVLEGESGVCGAVLARTAIRNYRPYFTIGPSEISKMICLALGTRTVGSLKKFIWPRNPAIPLLIGISLIVKRRPFLIRQESNDDKFPVRLSCNGVKFRRIEELDGWKEYHWKETIELSRSLQFLRWRFFNKYRKYYFYLTSNLAKPSYFVVRRCFWRGLIVLVIVDYRTAYRDYDSWQAILHAAKVLARLNRCDGVITGSSHEFFDKGLKRKSFIKVGRESLILTNCEICFSDEVIEKREIIYATMADCDTDLCFGE